ncbi:hypothetical protein [Streptomyces nitrosporeus]|uniref:Uncharacterized protein n=1 Tax=Streptomyces nitrosporeus TaxID=28894 RepID=A0A5J6FEH6_9ACTN|nr:hypothetical protein [Streptomyces nitrosporeus]QEU74503.1 hypothetical protein CP967_23180 [Streptomyces nitrosporeus]GGY83594.1 hypothetical protein GCM10010327_12300 [Streptomyces nitrosporeus]
MSYNQPGPYGGPPPQGQPGPYGQQPGPYGQQPGPYGGPPPQGPPQPGYGYPQQAPQGVPPQQQPPQPGYGYPQQGQQPGPYGQQPPTPPYGGQQAYGGMPPEAPKKKTGLIIGAAVVAVALVAGGVYFFTSGGGGGDVASDTKGYKLTPAASVDDYKKSGDGGGKSGPLTGEEKAKSEAMGVKSPNEVGAEYESGDMAKNPLTAKALMLKGVWGEIADPAKTLDGAFAGAKLEMEKEEDSDVSLVGSPEAVEPAGFEGALMKCQTFKVVNEEADGTVQGGPKEILTPVCIWADHSTVGIVIGIDVGAAMTNKAMPTADVAALAAKLYNTSRTKV